MLYYYHGKNTESSNYMTKRKAIIISASFILLFIVIFFALVLSVNRKPLPAGTVDKAVIQPISSEIYTQHDYDDAVECIKDYFPEFKNCELRELRYQGDGRESYKESSTGFQTMVIVSDFYAKDLPILYWSDASWNYGNMYKGWGWVLQRSTDDSPWFISTCGYG